jgi:hypothetical protein
MVALLRQRLFVYRDLLVWLDTPFEPTPECSMAEQLLLGLG